MNAETLESTGISPEEISPSVGNRAGRSFSIRGFLAVVTIIGLIIGNASLAFRLRSASTELERLRLETGYLEPSGPAQIAAVRVPGDEPLVYRFRVRVPGPKPYRLVYSTLLPKGRTNPDWYSAMSVPPGDSVVTIRIAEDPRDERWKISTLVRDVAAARPSDPSAPTPRDGGGTRRMGTVLPDPHTNVFRSSHDVVSTGVPRRTVFAANGESLRLLDERWLVGEGALLLYGDRPPDADQIGVYAELQATDHSI
ncbi:MAG: hypothetical protein AAGJ40_06675 [Planctomycetota bacterium]